MKYTNLTLKIRIDLVIGLIITFVPFLLYIHLFFDPFDVDFKLFDNEINIHFASLQTFIWYLLIKLISLILVAIWYYTEKGRYRHFIISPIFLFLYTLINHLLYGVDAIIGNLNSTSIMVTLIIITFIIIIDQRFAKKIRGYEFNESLYKLAIGKTKYVRIVNEVDKLLNKEGKNMDIKYFSRMTYIMKVIEENLKKYYISGSRSDYQNGMQDILKSLILLSLPIIFHFFQLVPKNITNIDFLGINLDTMGFRDINSLLWYLSLKLSIILPLMLWLISSKKWWKYSLLSPIFLFSYQLWNGISTNSELADETGFLQVLPVCIVIITSLVILTSLLVYCSRYEKLHILIMRQVDHKINELSKLPKYLHVRKEQFSRYKHFLVEKKSAEYLKFLVDFKSELINNIQD